MRNYLNKGFLNNKNNVNMPIVNALLKYGSDNFANYRIPWFRCYNYKRNIFYRKFQPYYNVLKQGYSSIGCKHTEATKELLSDLAKIEHILLILKHWYLDI